MSWCLPVIPATQETEEGELPSMASPRQKHETLSKGVRGVAQVVECLLSKHKASVQTPVLSKKIDILMFSQHLPLSSCFLLYHI
jgi:hypothetical protein